MVLPLLIVLTLCPYGAVPAAGGGTSCYRRLFSFGDSVNDAGNIISLYPSFPAGALPYGETFFRRPTGRFSDGRLIVDFIAEALGLPFSTPFLVGKAAGDFRQGANFAVAGSTALGKDFFREIGLDPDLVQLIPPYSLDVQLEWFRHVLQLLASTEQEREEIMSNSLFVVGEVGGNDYNYLISQNRSFTAEIKPLVIPRVVDKIEKAVKALIDLGAKTFIVPGDFPVGCTPRSLTMFRSSNRDDYDAAGCIKWLNDLAQHHNHAVKTMVEQIPRYPTVKIIYGDYYGSVLEIIRNPLKHGFSKDGARIACCGDGGPYNSNSSASCNATSNLCPDPSKHISWDGEHFTEAAYQFVASGMLHGPYASPSILSTCRCLLVPKIIHP